MMYVSYRNLLKKLCVLSCACALLVLVAFSSPCLAVSNARSKAIEDAQRQAENAMRTGPQIGSGMYDAYGNPINIIEEKKKPRLRDSLPTKVKERPLPDVPETDAGWQF